MALDIIEGAEQRFNKIIKTFPYTENVLQLYDNVTYNIRFYMLTNALQQTISRLREESDLTSYQIPHREKIIIAETGVSSKYNINSLKIQTVHTNTCNSHSATTYQLELQMYECNGCQLINHIAAVSKLVGYQGYVLQPFHIDVWFSGYEHSTHKPVREIPEVGVLTYEVTLGEVKTNIELGGTSYNFICTCAGTGSVPKDVLDLSDLGQIQTGAGMNIRDFAAKLEEDVSKRYFSKFGPEIEKNYYSNRKYMYIRLIDLENDTDKKWINNTDKEYVSETLKGVTLLSSLNPENDDKNETNTLNPSGTSNLFDIFQEFCQHTSTLKDYIARPIFKTENIKNAEGQTLSVIHMDVLFTKSLYLETFNKRFEDLLASHSKEDVDKALYTAALKQLQQIITHGLLAKRYDWMFNGRDTQMLEVNSSIDKLWYANIPTWDLQQDTINGFESYNTATAEKMINSILSVSNGELRDKTNALKQKVDEVIKENNKQLDSVRTLANDKRIYLEDVYNCLDEKVKNDFLKKRMLVELAQRGSDVKDTTGSNSSVTTTKCGYSNIFGSGNLVELQIKILGDPYWLALCSDNCIFNKSYNYLGNMQYFLFKMNTSAEQISGNAITGNFDVENVVDFCNIYQIIESTSVFENGAFTQNIKGIISPEFMIIGRLEA